jgi:hypothetical protein
MREHLYQILAHYVIYFRWRLNLPIPHDAKPFILKGALFRWHKKGLFQWRATVEDKAELDTEDWPAEDFLENNVEGSLNSIGLDTGFSSEMPLRSPSTFKCDAQPRSTHATSSRERFHTRTNIAPISIVDPPGPCFVYLSTCQSAEASNEHAFAEDIDAYNSACLGQIQTLSTYTSNQSEKEAAPWSGFVLQQHDKRSVFPEDVNDEDLSFPFKHCLAHTRMLSPSDGLSGPNVEPANPSPAEHYPRSRKKSQNCNREQNDRRVIRLSGATRHPALSPATSKASMNSTATKGQRLERSHLPEEDRTSASEVREQYVCFRSSLMMVKVYS